MVTILKKPREKLQCKEVVLPLATNPLLGTGIDVMTLPEGHLCCSQCKGHMWECWVYLDKKRLVMGCFKCGHDCIMLFPFDVSLSPFRNQGRFTCKRHPDKGMVLIHNTDVVCVGCEKCFTEVRIVTKTQNNIVIPDA